jgi:hypothetical protein
MGQAEAAAQAQGAEMTKPAWKVCNERRKVIAYAQRLARSGQHSDHATIIPLLEGLEGYEIARERLEQRAIRVQLDRLCAMARDRETMKVTRVRG